MYPNYQVYLTNVHFPISINFIFIVFISDNFHAMGGGNNSSPGNGTKCKPDSQRQQEDSEESGVGHEEEEEIQQLLLELLSNIRTPKVRLILKR